MLWLRYDFIGQVDQKFSWKFNIKYSRLATIFHILWPPLSFLFSELKERQIFLSFILFLSLSQFLDSVNWRFWFLGNVYSSKI